MTPSQRDRESFGQAFAVWAIVISIIFMFLEPYL